jgi:LmbE family N-acetylglucosaminyl deacetylase
MSAMSGFWASLRALSSRASSAAYPDAGNDFAHRTLLDHEALKPWTVEEIWMLNGTEPNHYVDVTDTFDQKIEALRAHRSQTGHRIIAPRYSGLTCIPVHPRLR